MLFFLTLKKPSKKIFQRKKVVPFTEKKHHIHFNWKLGSKLVETAKEYVYLGRIFWQTLENYSHPLHLESKATSHVSTLKKLYTYSGKRHFQALLEIYRIKIPPTLTYALEYFPETKWHFLHKCEGKFLRKITNTSQVTPVQALRLEISLTSAYTITLANTNRWAYNMHHAEKDTVRALLKLETFESGSGDNTFNKNLAVALSHFKCTTSLLLTWSRAHMKIFFKNMTPHISFDLDLAHYSQLSHFRSYSASLEYKIYQKYLKFTLAHNVRWSIILLRLGILPVNSYINHWDNSTREAGISNLCNGAEQNLAHRIHVCPNWELVEAQHRFLNPIRFRNNVLTGKDVMALINSLSNEFLGKNVYTFFKSFLPLY